MLCGKTGVLFMRLRIGIYGTVRSSDQWYLSIIIEIRQLSRLWLNIYYINQNIPGCTQYVSEQPLPDVFTHVCMNRDDHSFIQLFQNTTESNWFFLKCVLVTGSRARDWMSGHHNHPCVIGELFPRSYTIIVWKV